MGTMIAGIFQSRACAWCRKPWLLGQKVEGWCSAACQTAHQRGAGATVGRLSLSTARRPPAEGAKAEVPDVGLENPDPA
jgi:hypothetical protein